MTARWYAAAAEQAQPEADKSADAGETKAPAQEEDPVKKEMQAKDREIIDLKV